MVFWFTGALSLNHTNLIQYAGRPYSSSDEMNESLLDNINIKVKDNDYLYIVGNFLFGPLDEYKFIKTARYFRNKINCRNVYLLYSNHDRRGKKLDEFNRLFVRALDYAEIAVPLDGRNLDKHDTYNLDKDQLQTLILFAYPMELGVWNRANKGAWHLYSSSKQIRPFNEEIAAKRLNVGVDFAPRNLCKISGANFAELSREELQKLYRPYSFDEIKYLLA